MSNEKDRPRGILTQNDRALLRGEIDYSHKQQYSNRRRDIRERIANGLLDFNTIQYQLRDKDRKRIFQEPAEAAGVEDPLFYESICGMLYWTYFGLNEQNYDIEGMISESIGLAEEDFSRKYWGKSVDVDVRFDVEVNRSEDIEDLITAVEDGEPVRADRLYDFLRLSEGVPIDTEKIDTVRVWFRSAYRQGEKAVLQTLFSEYLGVEVEIEDIESHARLHESDMNRNAVIDPNQSRPNPREIKNYRSTTSDIQGEPSTRFLADSQESEGEGHENILEGAIDNHMEKGEEPRPSLHQLVTDTKNTDKEDESITPESLLNVLNQMHEPVVSTIDVAAAFDCTPDAARQVLSKLRVEEKIQSNSVLDAEGNRLEIWWLSSENE